MKINLGCGTDIRLGYNNIDILGGQSITRGDFRNLDTCGVTDASVEEMLAIDIIQYIKFKEVGSTLTDWVKKLALNGELHIESWDYNILGNMLSYDYIAADQLNNALYGDDKPQGLYNLVGIESFLRQLGMETILKGFKEAKFYLRMRKVQ